jgi:hypothetical protein
MYLYSLLKTYSPGDWTLYSYDNPLMNGKQFLFQIERINTLEFFSLKRKTYSGTLYHINSSLSIDQNIENKNYFIGLYNGTFSSISSLLK